MLFALKFRIFFIFSLIAGGFVAMMLNMKPVMSIGMWSLALILIVGYLLFGTVNGALFMLNTAKVKEAEKLLAQTYKPEWLFKSHKAYYYFTKGLISLHKVNKADGSEALYLKEGEEFLLMSLDLGLPRKQERAMAYLNLAAITLRRKDKAKTEEYYLGLKANETDNLRLQKSIEELEAALKKME
jgi:hypothetical protein